MDDDHRLSRSTPIHDGGRVPHRCLRRGPEDLRGRPRARARAAGRRSRRPSRASSWRSWARPAAARRRCSTSSPGSTSSTTARSASTVTTITGTTEDALAVMRRRHIGIVFQFFNLLDGVTALENVALPAMIAGAGASPPRPGPRPARPASASATNPASNPQCSPEGSASAWRSPGAGQRADPPPRRRTDRRARQRRRPRDPRAVPSTARRRPDDPDGHPQRRRRRGADRIVYMRDGRVESDQPDGLTVAATAPTGPKVSLMGTPRGSPGCSTVVAKRDMTTVAVVVTVVWAAAAIVLLVRRRPVAAGLAIGSVGAAWLGSLADVSGAAVACPRRWPPPAAQRPGPLLRRGE